jgi:hypothetical protein
MDLVAIRILFIKGQQESSSICSTHEPQPPRKKLCLPALTFLRVAVLGGPNKGLTGNRKLKSNQTPECIFGVHFHARWPVGMLEHSFVPGRIVGSLSQKSKWRSLEIRPPRKFLVSLVKSSKLCFGLHRYFIHIHIISSIEMRSKLLQRSGI